MRKYFRIKLGTSNISDYFRISRSKGLFGLLLFLGLGLNQTQAADGIAVSCNFTSGDPGLHSNGGFGPIYAYIIKNSKVTESRQLYNGNGKEAVINSSGKIVAFRKQLGAGKGAICIVPVSGGSVTELVKTGDILDEGRLLWPDGDWVYYTLGWPIHDTENFRGGNQIYRVNIQTKATEKWAEFTKAPWYWILDSKVTKMVARYMDAKSEPWGQNVHFELKNGKPPTNNLESLYNTSAKYGSLGGYGCGAGLSPSGKYMMNFTSTGHNGWHIRNFDGADVVFTLGVNTFDSWGGGDKLGGGNFGNKWSTNSDDWISIRQQGKQVLLNWKSKERIIVTQKDRNETGDFWLGTEQSTSTSPQNSSLLSVGTDSKIMSTKSKLGINYLGRKAYISKNFPMLNVEGIHALE